ncbi:MAG: UTP--glucose-1-phosphate uridylyltransferase [Chloroflexi bacterium]|nr:MAG: UTP--glucose-1-phosphate uridylyltransferase [Chloroflexota bacterium]
MRVRKAVIPAAGFGTRFLPVTKSMPKEMLPVAARPVIQYVVESVVASGIDQIILVTGSNKKAVEDFFDTNFELEWMLEKTGKQELLDEVRRVRDMAEIVYVRQKQPLGNGHAVLVAQHVVGDEPFLLLWGDDILLGDPPVPKQLLQVAARLESPVIGARRVRPQDFEKYGMLEVVPVEDRVSRALSVVEKPRRSDAPSDLAQIGGFVLTPDIFGVLARLDVGPSGEIYLADALVHLMEQRPVYAYEFTGRRYDAGNKFDYLRANIELALEDADIGPQLSEYLRDLDVASVAAS